MVAPPFFFSAIFTRPLFQPHDNTFSCLCQHLLVFFAKFLLSIGWSNGCKLFRCFTNCILE
nr:MAG TPA: hypothetical protein [Caudoviricetes sp.]